MTRARALTIVSVLGASLTTATLAMLPGSAHDEELAPAAQQPESPGPRAGEPIPMPPTLIGLEIRLGLDDEEPTAWEGSVEVSEGRVLSLEVEQSGPDGRVEGNQFRLRSQQPAAKKKAAAKKKQQAKKKAGNQAQASGAVAPTILRANFDAPAESVVTVTTGQGNFELKLSDLPRGTRKDFLDGGASVERIDPAVRLTGPPTEDDFPSAAMAPDGSIWVASVEYTPERHRLTEAVKPEDFDAVLVPTKNGDRIVLRRFDGRAWQPPVAATEAGLDVWRPAIAAGKDGALWLVWSQQVGGNWDIYARSYQPPAADADAGAWSEVVRLSDGPGSDFHPVAAALPDGKLAVAWQSWRDGHYDILAATLEGGRPTGPPQPVSESRVNDWGPALAVDREGRVAVAWDTYDAGNYDVRVRFLGDGGRTVAVAGSARFEARASIAFDAQGRLWVAYEEGDEQWGKDYANANPERVPVEQGGFPLYLNRTVRVKCLDRDGALKQAPGSLDEVFAASADRGKSLPRIAPDARGGIWLLWRQHPLANGAGETWESFATHHDGRDWSAARNLAASSNLLDNRPALVPFGDNLLSLHSTDARRNTQSRGQGDLYATILSPDFSDVRPPDLVPAEPDPAPRLADVHPDEAADKARARSYRIESGGKSLRLLRGEFHRHTEFTSHRDQDGLLEDAWRYALDAGDLDWMGDGDHMNGVGFEYQWWLIQKQTDLHHNAPRFVAAQSYERSAVYPNGHRNVMFPRRGIRPLPFGDLEGTPDGGTPDTKVLYAYLKHFGGLCASHTSATNMGTDWRDNDPEVEPVVEIYQGHRHNYEHLGAPRAPTADTQIGGYEPAGFTWNALAKGYRLGFQSSSDHVSTHWSYAVVLAEENSRQALVDAFKRRHCYAATDNIVLDVRSGDHLMGDAFEADRPPALDIVALGTSPIARLHVIRDNAYALSTEPGRREAKLRYTDDDAKPGESHYYYVRVEQEDGNLALASPLWITYKK